MIKSKISQSDYDTLGKDFEAGYIKWLESLAEIAVESVHNTDRFKGSPTGPLRNNFVITFDNDGFTFESSPFYSSYVDQGRGPVVPVRAKCLKFEIDGKVIFTKYVRPVAPRLFMDQALNAVEKEAEKTANDIFKG